MSRKRLDRLYRFYATLAGLPHHKTLDSFDFAFQPDVNVVRVKELATLRFVEQKANVIFLGPPGTGKTHLAVALGAIAACQRGFSISFTTLDDLVRQLKTADHRGQLQQKLKTYLTPTVLVVDEVGSLRLDRTEAHDLVQLVSRRYERGSVILTSNKTFPEWAEVLTINGPSYRLKDRP